MALDDLWDFDEPAASERRFRERLGVADRDERLELLTQIARAEGLQGRSDDAHATLDTVERALPDAHPRVRPRYLLERGRALRSAGRPGDALPLFRDALDAARHAGEDRLAVDAMHMVAITVTDPSEQIAWNERAIALATSSGAARRWLAPLHNNLGWTLFAVGRHAEALEQFERALGERRARGEERASRIAAWAVGRALRALGRVDEALGIQRSLLGEWRAAGGDSPYVNEEIGECLVALQREAEAPPYFAAAYASLSHDRDFASAHPDRLERMRRFSGEG